MKIVCDENIPLVEPYFSAMGELFLYPGRDIRAEHVKDADVLLVRSITQVNKKLLEGSCVSFVGTATIGEDHIDKGYLSNAGISFSSAPGCNANSVAEYIVAALFDWWENPAIEKPVSCLDRLEIGIVGAGSVGSRVKELCNALGVSAVCYDPFKPEWAHNKLEDLCQADIVSFHTPLTKGGPHPTYHLADHDFLKELKPGALLLNSGRGAVVDNQALYQLLLNGQDLQVGLDVWENEPGISQELVDLCYLATPHIAGYSHDGKVAGTRMLYEALCQYLLLDCDVQLPDEAVQSNAPHPRKKGLASSIATCVRYAYSIRQDDAALRKLMKNTEGAAQRSQGFDSLRKTYRKRREFSCYKLEKKLLNGVEQEKLKSLGFAVV
ncbi:MAG: 4-phosphoerythronate dehydrogenase [Gammaproteobacteria bacterium]|nr:4-phosphoerythronate dehydrogenase [Gammaproteobacteria bacterium]